VATAPDFKINCSHDANAIIIRSAEYVVGPNWHVGTNNGPCAFPGYDTPSCMLSTEAISMKCINAQQCTFGREVFNYRQCALRPNDVIKVTYNCIDGK